MGCELLARLATGRGFLVKVVFTTPAWPPELCANGIVTYVERLRGGLEQLDVDSRVLAARVEGPEDDSDITNLARCDSRFARAERFRDRAISRFLREDILAYRGARRVMTGLRRLEPDFSPDVLEMEESFGSASHVSKRARVPLVLRLHGPWFLNGTALGARRDDDFNRRVAIEGKTIVGAKAITSPSQDLLDRVRREYEIDVPHAEVIPNPGPVVHEGSRWKLASSDPDLLLFVGRFDRHKGGDLVIDAFCALAANRPRLKLVFTGPIAG